MHWRLYAFFLAVTAAFCFLLVTAVTDYGSPDYHPALMSSRTGGERLLSTFTPNRDAAEPREAPLSLSRFDPNLRPGVPTVFVPRNADPILERHELERTLQTEKRKAPPRRRLMHDEHGWYRQELALVTAYCPCAKCCGTHSPGITSIGKNAWTPGLAADPIYLDYGTRVFVPEYGLSVIDDTGGAMRRHWRRDGKLHIDVRMTYHYEARQWGKQYLFVKIYDEQ